MFFTHARKSKIILYYLFRIFHLFKILLKMAYNEQTSHKTEETFTCLISTSKQHKNKGDLPEEGGKWQLFQERKIEFFCSLKII